MSATAPRGSEKINSPLAKGSWYPLWLIVVFTFVVAVLSVVAGVYGAYSFWRDPHRLEPSKLRIATTVLVVAWGFTVAVLHISVGVPAIKLLRKGKKKVFIRRPFALFVWLPIRFALREALKAEDQPGRADDQVNLSM